MPTETTIQHSIKPGYLDRGKLPPQSIDLEQAVIGAMMIDATGTDKVSEILKSVDFYDNRHQLIYDAICKLYSVNDPIDLLTVSNQLKKMKKLDSAGGDHYLIQLTQMVASSAHIEYHSRIIKQQSVKRTMIEMAGKIIEQAYQDSTDVFDLLDISGKYFDGINDSLSSSYNSVSWYDAAVSMPKQVEKLTNRNGEITGLPTGLDATDLHFSGWQPTDLIVIGADSGMGKTAFVMCSMLANGKAGNPVGMFSMEMSVRQLVTRAFAVESNFHMNQLARKGFAEDDPEKHNGYFQKLNNYANIIKDYPIHIDDKPALTVAEMKRKARSMKRKHGIKLLVIDFLQMFDGDKDIRINVSQAARECKNIAKELEIPVIALSQLSREVNKTQYKLPGKHHLKEASAIEEAADIIGLLYRPEYYGFDFANNMDFWVDTLGLQGEQNAVMLVAKNRNGALGNIGLKFINNKTKYVNDDVPLHSVHHSQQTPF